MNGTADNRSKKFVLIPFCLLAQAYHARGLVKYEWRGVIKPVIDEIVKRDINIIQMPCPESLFPSLEKSLDREPKSYLIYDSQDFRGHCKNLAKGILAQVKAIIGNGYEILAILGIEYSPSCAIKIQYTKNGTTDLSGIFIQEIKKLFLEESINIPFIGINRKGIKPSLSKLNALLDQNEQITLFE